MANAKSYTAQGEEKGSVELPAALFDQQVNEHLLYQANGNVSAAARMSGTERRHLGRLLKKYGVPKLPPAAPDQSS